MSPCAELTDGWTVLEELDSPARRTTVASEIAAVTLVLADGGMNLGDLMSQTPKETFAVASDVESELTNVLPEGLVKPDQSEWTAYAE